MSTASTLQQQGIKSIFIHGAGLAGQMCAAALAHGLPEHIKIIWASCAGDSDADMAYGNVTTPDSYAFNLGAGVSEPDLVLESSTAFSFGTHYTHWGANAASWTQCFHLPLPIIDAVPFHHHLIRRQDFALGPYLISAGAASSGRFAHPPENSNIALARAEYGYQFDPRSYGALFVRAAKAKGVSPQKNAVERVDSAKGEITSVTLSNGQTISADLYIDCSGPEASMLSQVNNARIKEQDIFVVVSHAAQTTLGAPKREVSAAPYGYRAVTPLQGQDCILTVCDAQDHDQAMGGHDAQEVQSCALTLGRNESPWTGNCIALGQAGACFDPLTPAPMKAVQRDIERLLSLIPIDTDMDVERKEYNRLARDDYDNIGLFSQAFFYEPVETHEPSSPYWAKAAQHSRNEKLARKIEQFKARGLLVNYDLEPFNPQDWTVLYFGLGLKPQSYDRVADRLPLSDIDKELSALKRGVETLIGKLPPHHIYMTKLRQHLLNRQG